MKFLLTMKFPLIVQVIFLCTTISTARAQVTLEQFQEIAGIFEKEFASDLTTGKARLEINRPPSPRTPDFWWNLTEKHASYSSSVDKNGYRVHLLFLFGGYAKMPGMTADGVAMTLCHELGHGIGGAPMKEKSDGIPSSTEGQADYFAARHCLRRIFKHLAPSAPIQAPSAYTASLCEGQFQTAQDLINCHRGFQVLEVQRIFLKGIPGGADTFYETPDTTVVQAIDASPTYYPAPQCRLDTMIAGILQRERPRCWWAPKR